MYSSPLWFIMGYGMRSFETSFPFSQQLFLGLLCVSEFTPTSFSMFAAHSIVCMYIPQFDQPFINKAANSYLVCIPLFFFFPFEHIPHVSWDVPGRVCWAIGCQSPLIWHWDGFSVLFSQAILQWFCSANNVSSARTNAFSVWFIVEFQMSVLLLSTYIGWNNWTNMDFFHICKNTVSSWLKVFIVLPTSEDDHDNTPWVLIWRLQINFSE